MDGTARFRRLLTAGSLVTTALLSAISVAFQPEFGSTAADRLAAIDEAGARGAVSSFAFVLAQLPFIAAVLGLGHLLRDRAPALANVAPCVAVLGGFGHAVFGGAMLLTSTMATAPGNRRAYAQVLDRFESSPATIFAILGLLGTVIGILLLAIGLWRAHVGPRWVAPTLLAFLVVEFVGAGLSHWASVAAVVLYVAAFGALAAGVVAMPDRAWASAGSAEDSTRIADSA